MAKDLCKSNFSDRDRFQDILRKVLRSSEDERFIQTLWAVNGLQSDFETPVEKYLRNIPAEAATTELTSKWAVYKWEIEDLANELYCTPKRQLPQGKALIDYADVGNFLKIAGTLRALQNAEDGIDLIASPILKDLRRVIARQFDWQRGYLNQAQFYRSSFIYGQGACSEFFLKTHGLTINEFTFVGFGAFCFLMENPFMHYKMDWSQLKLSTQKSKAALDILSAPSDEIRRLATELRKTPGHSGYKPSFLRRYPCILFNNARIRSPLPQLILERVTSGLFFDVVDGGGEIRSDYGRRFEEYSIDLLRAMLPDIQFVEEWAYGSRSSRVKSPDIICRRGDVVQVALECKATRMSFAAKVSRDPRSERGFEDLTKAVFQLWRFFAHCRMGRTSVQADPSAVGMVLTLESWLTMAPHLHRDILDEAVVMADKAGDILEEDRRPIAFCAIVDLENVLKYATESTFLEAAKEAAEEENFGWMFTSIHERFQDEASGGGKPFPFSAELGELLPWWKETHEHFEKAEAGSLAM